MLLGLGSALSAALAQNANPGSVSAEDRAAIASCVRESLDRPRACIGTIAVVCARQAQGDRREAEIACTRREAAVWRERLDLATINLAQRLEPGPRSRFAAEQRSWESYVGLKCAFVGWQEPIGCGGVAVFPNDIVVADGDGAVVIPAAYVEEVAKAGPEQEMLELWLMREVEKGVPLPGLYPPNAETKARYEAEKGRS